MNDKRRKPNLWRYLIGTRKFWYGFLIMLLAVLLSFASIYRTVQTDVQSYTWDGETENNYVNLIWRQDVQTNNMYLHYRGYETVNIIITDEVLGREDPLHNIRLQAGDEFNEEISPRAQWLIIEDFTHFEGEFEMEYTVEYYAQPYSILSLFALAMVFLGLYFISQGYQVALDNLVEDMRKAEERKGDELEDYKPPIMRKKG